ncbi:MAG: DNA translocase FtsK, partial [Oscillospiraceae bacterium]|nr:DNA translocase FtsK [Oscillospiraceae bacterium]
MPQTKKAPPKKNSRAKSPAKKPARQPRRREIGAAVCLALSLLLFFGYGAEGGWLIAAPRDFILRLIGGGFYAMPPALLLCAFILGFHRGQPVRFRVVCSLLLPAALGVLIHLFACDYEYTVSADMLRLLWTDAGAGASGGVVSGALAVTLAVLTNKLFTEIIFIIAMIFLLFSAFNRTLSGLIDAVRNRERREYEPQPPPPPRESAPRRRRRSEIDIPLDDVKQPLPPHEHNEPYAAYEDAYIRPVDVVPDPEPEPKSAPESEPNHEAEGDVAAEPDPRANDIPLDIPFMEGKRATRDTARKPHPPTAAAAKPADKSRRRAVAEALESLDGAAATVTDAEYAYPPVELLASGAGERGVDGSEEVRMNSERLEVAFRSFGVSVKITNATRGPSVTRYEAELEAGTKLSKLTNLTGDIALALGASGVRIGPMPERISTVSVEVPNKIVSTVYLRDIIESPEFRDAPSRLTFAIGKNIPGESIVGNISRLTHVLIAGTTGSGKSVCLNSLILSILYKSTPDEVRFIMIDPKIVEFRVFNGIPHLLIPVVTDVKKAAGALQWAVIEMERRYNMFAEQTARDIDGFNRAMMKKGEKTMYRIVVVIDELADLMMTCGKEVEESIVRVAQKGRAAGIHLVIATQSPRANVITGLMKANLPSKIALKVSSALESRIILDAGGGADKLVGNGDMLFAPNSTAEPMRVQGTWVSDEEREAVVNHVKQLGETQYADSVIEEINRTVENAANAEGVNANAPEYDEMLPAAADVIFEFQRASTSTLQSRLRLGYARAARIMDQLEQVGVVGPFEGSKPRQILLTRDQWREMQLIHGTAPIGAAAMDTAPPDDSPPDIDPLSLDEPDELSDIDIDADAVNDPP